MLAAAAAAASATFALLLLLLPFLLTLVVAAAVSCKVEDAKWARKQASASFLPETAITPHFLCTAAQDVVLLLEEYKRLAKVFSSEWSCKSIMSCFCWVLAGWMGPLLSRGCLACSLAEPVLLLPPPLVQPR